MSKSLSRKLLLALVVASTSVASAHAAPPATAGSTAPMAGNPDTDFTIFNNSLRHQAMVDICLAHSPELGRQLETAYRQWSSSRTGAIQRTTDSMAAYNVQAKDKVSIGDMRTAAAVEMQQLVDKARGDHRAACADALRWFAQQPVATDVVVRGKTAADRKLLQDIFSTAVASITARDGCDRVDAIDIKALDKVPGNTPINAQGRLTSGKLSEEWTLHGCGKSFAATVTLKPDAKGEVDYAVSLKGAAK